MLILVSASLPHWPNRRTFFILSFCSLLSVFFLPLLAQDTPADNWSQFRGNHQLDRRFTVHMCLRNSEAFVDIRSG